MKVTITKKISQVHWSAFVAAIVCFLGAAIMYKDYKRVKMLIEEGSLSPGIVIENCKKYSRGGNYIKLNLVAKNRLVDVKTDNIVCDEKTVGDTITVLYAQDFDDVIIYAPNKVNPKKNDLYFSIFTILLGCSFILIEIKKE